MRMKDAFENYALLVVVLCMTDEGLMFVVYVLDGNVET